MTALPSGIADWITDRLQSDEEVSMETLLRARAEAAAFSCGIGGADEVLQGLSDHVIWVAARRGAIEGRCVMCKLETLPGVIVIGGTAEQQRNLTGICAALFCGAGLIESDTVTPVTCEDLLGDGREVAAQAVVGRSGGGCLMVTDAERIVEDRYFEVYKQLCQSVNAELDEHRHEGIVLCMPDTVLLERDIFDTRGGLSGRFRPVFHCSEQAYANRYL